MVILESKIPTKKASANTASDIECDKKARVSIAGATGYVGQELLRLLLLHPNAEVVALASNSHEGESYEDILPGFSGELNLNKLCLPIDLQQLAATSDIVFLALPHGVAAESVSKSVLSQTKVIDMSGDFRLQNPTEKAKWYGTAHGDLGSDKRVVYGLPELNREEISKASLVANPGCYATAAILPMAALLKAGVIHPDSIILDGKSGVSGAGRRASLNTHFNECNESMKAYSLPIHRHTPEIEQTLSALSTEEVITTFSAHLVPMNRGILLTAYATLKKPVSNEDVQSIYANCYGNEPFIRLLPPGKHLPETRWVKGSNYCDIGFAIDERTNRIVVVSAIDNLIKGAAGQAVQNMNILLGLEETTGLKQIPAFL